ncbi:DinB family protein [Chitinophaga sp. GCM10012297]|uniref:DinB family protein n=1 Tax=Chitinophaga chungangae TaxID=2821488 RepID=A0ABS3Y813_9BACT|nr:DinB family protein [Chitinophaga chungangae]MBO9150817.1 DinB family protein [Chitinophaga chungangae]
MKEVSILINNLKELLNGGHAHATFEQAVKDLPAKLQGQVPEGMPYSIWQLVEHIRITQLDILEFSRDPGYESPQWPEGYWPKEQAPENAAAWKESITQITNDRKTFIGLLEAPGADLFTPFAHGSGQNLLREAMLIADHTSYHTGEIIVLRRLMGAWK